MSCLAGTTAPTTSKHLALSQRSDADAAAGTPAPPRSHKTAHPAPTPTAFHRYAKRLPWHSLDGSHPLLPAMAGLDSSYGGSNDNIYTRLFVPWLSKLARTMALSAKLGMGEEVIGALHMMFLHPLYGCFEPHIGLPSEDVCMDFTDAWKSRKVKRRKVRSFFKSHNDGYLQIDLGNGQYEYAHRVICWAFNGPSVAYMVNGVVKFKEVCHSCNNTHCLHPMHLRWGEHYQNSRAYAWPAENSLNPAI